jgi:DNA-binding NarL/FixJ family response regulator
VNASIVLADDHRIVRQGLRRLLEAERVFKVVGETGDGLEATALVERLRPEVLVLDVMMPGLSGLDVTLQVARRVPATRVVVLSMYASDAYVFEALRNGAWAYVLKDVTAAELVRAIRSVLSGRRYLSPPLSAPAVLAHERKVRDTEVDIYETLTAREREVLHLAAEGLTAASIAGRLGISLRTAETHRAHLMRKLGLHGRAQLVRYALQRGLLAASSGDPASPSS